MDVNFRSSLNFEQTSKDKSEVGFPDRCEAGADLPSLPQKFYKQSNPSRAKHSSLQYTSLSAQLSLLHEQPSQPLSNWVYAYSSSKRTLGGFVINRLWFRVPTPKRMFPSKTQNLFRVRSTYFLYKVL